MDTSAIDGLLVRSTLGSGATGTVYLAEDAEGNSLAVKVFRGMSINRQLLMRTTTRLEAGGWPQGVMPVISASYESKPAVRITRCFTDDNGQPSSLQHRLASYPAANSWEIVRELTRALSGMHKRQVAHGNLKPGNVFFSESGELLLTDWAIGQMPGIGHLEFTDAFLYQAPEQLQEPEGYLDEAGYRWDVFSFGVLSRLLLSGEFPRCNEPFTQVAPPPGETKREGIVANTHKIALSLKEHDHLSWPDNPRNTRESQYRELLDSCVSLQVLDRPASMVEVLNRFEEIDFRIDAEEHRDMLLDQRRRTDRRAWFLAMAAGVLLGIGVLLATMLLNAKNSLAAEKTERKAELLDLKRTTIQAIDARKIAEEKLLTETTAARAETKQAIDTLRIERGIWLARVESARDAGDHLFAWALEKGNRNLPPLDGREQRLKRIESYYSEFLEKNAGLPELEDERARSQLHLAEISLALGDAEKSAARLELALAAWEKLEKTAEWEMRIATDKLLLALLWQGMSDARSNKAFVEARDALAKVRDHGADLDRLKQLRAILDYHEAKNLAEAGEDAKALDQLTNATRQLNELVDSRPDAMVLRSELSNCFLSTATILEGMGRMGDAREVRVLAVNELVAQLKQKPTDFSLRMDLAGAYGSMAEASVLAGDVYSAEQVSKEAVTLLEKLIREQPDNSEAASRLAAQRGLTAGMLEDRGDSVKAKELVDDGIRILESHVAAEKGDALAKFRLAMLLWQKGRISGAANDRKLELALCQQALDIFLKLTDKDHGFLRTEQVKRSMAYLLGDMGHSALLCKDKEKAKKSFSESIKVWQELLNMRPKNEEYEEGLSWSKNRFKDL